MEKRIYLPRSTVDYCVIRAVYAVAEDNGISFGRALELMLMKDGMFEETLLTLTKDSKMFGNDVAIFKKSR